MEEEEGGGEQTIQHKVEEDLLYSTLSSMDSSWDCKEEEEYTE